MQILFQRNIRFNSKLNTYIAIEAGWEYTIKTELIDSLNAFLAANPLALIAEWYRQLDAVEKDQTEKRLAFAAGQYY